jgi:ABC-type uncharacterized transport system permease subunit
MPWLFFTFCILIGIPVGFASFSKGAFFTKKEGKIVVGILTWISFGFVALGFYLYGWKIGIATVFLILAASNIGLTILKKMER